MKDAVALLWYYVSSGSGQTKISWPIDMKIWTDYYVDEANKRPQNGWSRLVRRGSTFRWDASCHHFLAIYTLPSLSFFSSIILPVRGQTARSISAQNNSTDAVWFEDMPFNRDDVFAKLRLGVQNPPHPLLFSSEFSVSSQISACTQVNF
jgi:hypothetical protein